MFFFVGGYNFTKDNTNKYEYTANFISTTGTVFPYGTAHMAVGEQTAELQVCIVIFITINKIFICV